MPCLYHNDLCAFPDWTPEKCEYCHCSWTKITAPATRITTRQTVSRPTKRGPRLVGKPIVVEDIAYLNGYGDTPLSHLWRHAEEDARAAADAVRRAASRRKTA